MTNNAYKTNNKKTNKVKSEQLIICNEKKTKKNFASMLNYEN